MGSKAQASLRRSAARATAVVVTTKRTQHQASTPLHRWVSDSRTAKRGTDPRYDVGDIALEQASTSASVGQRPPPRRDVGTRYHADQQDATNFTKPRMMTDTQHIWPTKTSAKTDGELCRPFLSDRRRWCEGERQAGGQGGWQHAATNMARTWPEIGRAHV